MKQDGYTKRVNEFIGLIQAAVEQGRVGEVALARRLESIGRKIRRNAQVADTPWQDGHTKYGRLCNANRAQYREDVNFFYWKNNWSVGQISRKFGISEVSVSKLIDKDSEWAPTTNEVEREREAM